MALIVVGLGSVGRNIGKVSQSIENVSYSIKIVGESINNVNAVWITRKKKGWSVEESSVLKE
jgi:hypothetical protein